MTENGYFKPDGQGGSSEKERDLQRWRKSGHGEASLGSRTTSSAAHWQGDEITAASPNIHSALTERQPCHT